MPITTFDPALHPTDPTTHQFVEVKKSAPAPGVLNVEAATVPYVIDDAELADADREAARIEARIAGAQEAKDEGMDIDVLDYAGEVSPRAAQLFAQSILNLHSGDIEEDYPNLVEFAESPSSVPEGMPTEQLDALHTEIHDIRQAHYWNVGPKIRQRFDLLFTYALNGPAD